MDEHSLWPTRLRVVDSLWKKIAADSAANDDNDFKKQYLSMKKQYLSMKKPGVGESSISISSIFDRRLTAAAVRAYDSTFSGQASEGFETAHDRNNAFFGLQSKDDIHYRIDYPTLRSAVNGGDTGGTAGAAAAAAAAAAAVSRATATAKADATLHQNWKQSKLWHGTPEVVILVKAAYKVRYWSRQRTR
jgi:hypothetical protein